MGIILLVLRWWDKCLENTITYMLKTPDTTELKQKTFYQDSKCFEKSDGANLQI